MSEHFVKFLIYCIDGMRDIPIPHGIIHITQIYTIKFPEKKANASPKQNRLTDLPPLSGNYTPILYVNLPKDMGLLNILCARAVSHYTLTVETVFILKHGHLVYPR